ncbi:MAG TPA: hypothetical protein VM370_03055 [Candidatus Thermoplasmatota archaeon]|nr:hypothetical protein [Candidatus Thermoplasmatota archaeon]
MQMRLLLVAILAFSVALAGCAENKNGGDAQPPAQVTNAEAQSLFAQASGNVPEKYGMDMKAVRGSTQLMGAQAAYDQTANVSFFHMTMDETLLEQMGSGAGGMGGMMGDASAFKDVSVYASPQGNAILVNGTVMLTKPEQNGFGEDSEGFSTLSDPEAFLEGMKSDNFTVNSVTPTTLRGKGALKLDATVVEDGARQNVTVWLFQDPTRIARLEAAMPAEGSGGDGDEGDTPDPFRGATMQIDLLYDDEVTTRIPADLARALGLRYESNRMSFTFGGGDASEPEMWTFQASPATIPLGEVEAQVGSMEDMTHPAWTMPLTVGTKTQDGLTITFADKDHDGKVGLRDTLTVERGDDDEGLQVVLKDTKTGLLVVPGAGAAIAALAGVVGALLAGRRRG